MRQQTLLKIVNLMRVDLDKGLTILYISKKLKIGYRPAYMHIAGMEKEGLIKVEKVGNAKQCFLNLSNVNTKHLLEEVDITKKEELLKKTPKLRLVLEPLIQNLAERFVSELHSIVLFGSYAKGTSVKNSDVDLLFIVNNLKNKNLRGAIEQECASYQHSYSIKISPLITDVEEFKKMLQSKELNVGKESRQHGISLYGYEFFWRLL